MTISYPLNFPSSPRPRRARIIARANVAIAESQFSFTSQKQVHSGQRWELDLELPPMTKADAGAWLGFLLSLNGKEGTVMVPDPDRRTAQGVATGTPIVNGGSQTGGSLNTAGWTTSTANILKAGDLIQIGNYMYMNLSDVSSGAGGSATLDIWPDLRSSPTASAAITIANCKTKMRLVTNEMSWSTNEFEQYGITLVFEEDL